ncbi:MAG: hypothetical protein EHM61_14545 [Acidobacteria bacterium]|nr:MAG: hypothetical protein EHM61_14545 [Acidobacteriota bacterium]
MTSWNLEMDDDQLDSLKEVGNVGAGHAASELATLIGRKCVVSVPELTCTDAAGIGEFMKGPDTMVVALHMSVLGDIPANMLVLTRRSHAQLMLNYMSPTSAPQAEQNEEAFKLALRQLGEVLTRSFADAISHFLGTNAPYAFTEAINGGKGGIVAGVFPASEPQPGPYMAVHADFFDEEKTIQGKLVYLLSSRSQALILERIEQLLG